MSQSVRRQVSVRILIAFVVVGFAAIPAIAPRTVRADHLPIHGAILARAPFADAVDVKFKVTVDGKLEVSNAPNAGDAIVQEILLQPGAFTGWHTHPGPAVAIVTAGTLTLYEGDDPTCTGRPYGPAEAFVDVGQGNVHAARNEGAVAARVYVTYFDVPSTTASPLVLAPDPGNCSF
jgi:quercetin dioxygenase-like cupin family protein